MVHFVQILCTLPWFRDNLGNTIGENCGISSLL